jgi:hypothetical protein
VNPRLALGLRYLANSLWPRAAVARRHDRRAGYVRIVVDTTDFPPDRTKSHAVANYVRALIKYHALRRELANAALDVARCKKAVADRMQAQMLMAEAHEVCEELGIDVDISVAPAADRSR